MRNQKFIATILSFLIIFLLILSGPAQAYTINFDIVDKKVSQGDTVNFIIDLEFNNQEIVNNLSIELKNSFNETIKCNFNLNAEIISGCSNINIQKISEETAEYSYGYNYGYGYSKKITYSLAFNTTNYREGDYKTYLTTYYNNSEDKKKGEIITISKSNRINLYSVRANNGKIAYINNDTNFTYTNIDFSSWTTSRFMNRKNIEEVQGQGTLILFARTNAGKIYKINLNFDNTQILENSNSWLNVSGKPTNAYLGEENNAKQKLICGSLAYKINKLTGLGEILVNCNNLDLKIKNINFKFI